MHEDDEPQNIVGRARTETDPKKLEELSAYENWRVRAAVGENEHSPTHVLTSLFRDPDSRVRAAVAGNPRAPKDLLSKMERDGAGAVKRALAENPSTPEDVRKRLRVRLAQREAGVR